MPVVDLHGIRIHYLDRPGPGDVPLVLLHGLGSSSRDWERNLESLGDGRRVVVPDLRGFGKSDRPPGPYRPQDFAADVSALLEELKIERFDLLGYSMGGAAAFQLAVDEPGAIRKLILVNTTPSYELTTWRARWEAFMRLTVVRFIGMDRMARIIAGRLFPKPEQEDLRKITIERYSQNDKASYLAALQGLIGWTVQDQIAGIDIPTLVIAADQDYTPVATKEAYVATMPQAQLRVIEDSRHGTPMDQIDLFNQVVVAFLDAD
jgi:pimeloyl-ACP methyl ester carboxylesterase